MPQLKPIVWTLDEALALVREIQPQTRPFGYHLALGGGVLNTGQSRKDLDLYFLPMDEKDSTPRSADMARHLTTLIGTFEYIGNEEYKDNNAFLKLKFANGGKRIDAFIWQKDTKEETIGEESL